MSGYSIRKNFKVCILNKVNLHIQKWLLKSQILSIKNYFLRKLDRITQIELFLFLVFGIVFFIYRIDLILYWVLQKSTQAGWDLYLNILLTIYLVTIVSIYPIANKKLKSSQNKFLLSQPVSPTDFRYIKTLDILFLFLPIVPVVIISFLVFSIRLSLPFLVFSIGFVKILLLTTGSFASGLAISTILMENSKASFKFYRYALTLILVALNVYTIVFFKSLFLSITIIFLMMSIMAISHILFHWSLDIHLKEFPEFFSGPNKKASKTKLHPVMSILLVSVPKSLRPIVKKDFYYALRKYKSFLIMVLALLIVTLTGIFSISDATKAAGWLVFMISASAYCTANLAFKFNEENVELMKCIKSLWLAPQLFWWAKFFTTFVSLIWIIVISFLAFGGKFGFVSPLLFQSLALSLFLAFTLVFFQTNFSLYSYPYARYAPLWYNMYIILAVMFFTTFLFPPLTIAFLLLGYLAIFRVLKRIQNREVF